MRASEIFLTVLLAIELCVLVAVAIAMGTDINRQQHQIQTLKTQAIDLNYAQYNPTNGIWEWKTNNITE